MRSQVADDSSHGVCPQPKRSGTAPLLDHLPIGQELDADLRIAAATHEEYQRAPRPRLERRRHGLPRRRVAEHGMEAVEKPIALRACHQILALFLFLNEFFVKRARSTDIFVSDSRTCNTFIMTKIKISLGAIITEKTFAMFSRS